MCDEVSVRQWTDSRQGFHFSDIGSIVQTTHAHAFVCTHAHAFVYAHAHAFVYADAD